MGDVATKLLLDPALTLRVLTQVGEWVKQRHAALAGGFQPGGEWKGGWIAMDDLAPLLRGDEAPAPAPKPKPKHKPKPVPKPQPQAKPVARIQIRGKDPTNPPPARRQGTG